MALDFPDGVLDAAVKGECGFGEAHDIGKLAQDHAPHPQHAAHANLPGPHRTAALLTCELHGQGTGGGPGKGLEPRRGSLKQRLDALWPLGSQFRAIAGRKPCLPQGLDGAATRGQGQGVPQEGEHGCCANGGQRILDLQRGHHQQSHGLHPSPPDLGQERMAEPFQLGQAEDGVLGAQAAVLDLQVIDVGRQQAIGPAFPGGAIGTVIITHDHMEIDHGVPPQPLAQGGAIEQHRLQGRAEALLDLLQQGGKFRLRCWLQLLAHERQQLWRKKKRCGGLHDWHDGVASCNR